MCLLRQLSRRFVASGFVVLLACFSRGTTQAQEATPAEARRAMHRAVEFFREHAASEGGGYVYRLSEDLQKREGEGAVGPSTAWIEPPGTPAVGMAYLQAYQLTGDPLLREAAIETADALIRGQLESGGWDNQMEFGPEQRRKYAYRVEPQKGKRNVTTLDDNKSQSAASFLMRLDEALNFKHLAIHEAAQYALDSFVRAQHANGAWPQRYSEFPEAELSPPRQASFPDEWPREFPKRDYGDFYTLNDNTIRDTIETMLLAHRIYGDPQYLDAALRAGDFLLLAQLPEPQPGWAQQYDHLMQPAWARKFEPPAITGGESQGVMSMLMRLYRETGEKKYLEPIPRAVEYYRGLLLDDGQLARFYEIGTDRPLYFTKDYQLTYSDADMPTHYGFKVGSRLDSIEREYKELIRRPPPKVASGPRELTIEKPRLSDSLTRRAAEVIAALDERGAWVEDGRLRYHGDDDPTRRVIDLQTFAENLLALARYLSATESVAPPTR